MRSMLLIMLLVFGVVTSSQAGEYNYISATDMKSKIQDGSDVIIVDIQVKEEFKKHHLPGSLATYAYPVKTDSERILLNEAIKLQKKTDQDVVIVCPRGKGGAKRGYDYMLKQDIAAEKLFILEKGIAGWPHKEMLEKS